jgi:hypothetical protein
MGKVTQTYHEAVLVPFFMLKHCPYSSDSSCDAFLFLYLENT